MKSDFEEGKIDNEGNRLIKNEKSSGHYHSDWLNMMYPRLKLARNLMSDDASIFVSIDDKELANLKLLMDEIFGESNYQVTISRLTGTPTGNGNATFVNELDYILVYAKDGTVIYPKSPTGYDSRWVVGKEKYKQMISENLISWKKVNQEWKVYQKFYLENRTHQPSNLWKYNTGNKKATKEIRKLFDNKKVFDFPKPVSLISQILQISTPKDGLILDFFAGSGSTAEAVIQLNLQDGGNRKFIISTLDEQTPKDSDARKEGYETIDQISRERIRRSAEKLGDVSGFRALKVDSSGLNEDIFKTASELEQGDLLQDIDNQSDNRSDFDLLFDVLVDGALEYNCPIMIDKIKDEKIIKYDYLGELSGVVCYFGNNLTDELTRQIATLKPLVAVFKEATFDKSSQKVNVMEQFRIISPDTKVKVI